MNPYYLYLLVLIQTLCFSRANCQNSNDALNELDDGISFGSKEIITLLRKPLQDSLYLVSQNSKYGIIDSTGGVVVPMIYDQISVNFAIREALLLERKYLPENELFYFFWEEGNESEELYNRLLIQEMNSPNSPYNLELAFRTKPFFAAKKENLWGVINAKNEALIPFEYDFIEEIGQNIFLVKKNNSFEILTPDNESIVTSCDTIIVPSTINYIPLGSEFAVYAILIRDNKYGAINLRTREMILPQYDSLEFCYMLPEDSWLCAFNPDDIRFNSTVEQFNRTHLYANVIRYKMDSKVGLVDMLCMQEITEASFDNIRVFSGYQTKSQIVQLDNMYTFLMHDNTQIHDKLYDSVRALTGHGYYKVSLNGNTGIYNDFGEKVLDLKWDDVQSSFNCYYSSSPYFIVKRKGKFGVVDSRKRRIIPIRYDNITFKYENQSHFLELRRKEKLKKINPKDL